MSISLLHMIICYEYFTAAYNNLYQQAIVSSLGKTRHLLVSGLIGSWLGQVPTCLLFTRLWRDDMTGSASQYYPRL